MISKLPILKITDPIHQTCEGKNNCPTCPLFEKFCRGCQTASKKEACGNQTSCQTGCNNCHGAQGRLIAGVCCKSPLAPFAIAQIKTLPQLKYTPQPKLDFPDERIPVLINRQHRSPAPVNAIGLPKVYSAARRCWKSKDIKDYLNLDKKTKLILLTSMRENQIDVLMDKPWHEDVYRVGFDHWQAIGFSMFQDDGQMMRLLSFWRMMKGLSVSQAHFVPFSYEASQRLMIDPYFEDAIKAVPNIFWEGSHGSEQSAAMLRTLGYVKKYGAIYGNKVSWFFRGFTEKSRRLVIRSLLPEGTSCYFFITPKSRSVVGDQYGWHDEKPRPGSGAIKEVSK